MKMRSIQNMLEVFRVKIMSKDRYIQYLRWGGKNRGTL
jgi:hypothetical protein